MSDSFSINYPETIFRYPSKSAALTAGIAFNILSMIFFARIFHRNDWWGLCIGAFFFSLGFFLRFALSESSTTFALFVTSQVLVVVSPAAFLAFNYIVYGRLMRAFAAGQTQYSLIRPEIVARVFIISDIVTFVIQGNAGGLQAQASLANVGRIILLIGIIAQTLSYVLFFILLIHSHFKFSKDGKFDNYNFPWRLVHVLHFSSVFIITRAEYRLIELAQGNSGYLIRHEVYFYVSDTIPLFLATAIYAFFWPGKLTGVHSSEDYLSVRMGAMGSPSP